MKRNKLPNVVTFLSKNAVLICSAGKILSRFCPCVVRHACGSIIAVLFVWIAHAIVPWYTSERNFLAIHLGTSHCTIQTITSKSNLSQLGVDIFSVEVLRFEFSCFTELVERRVKWKSYQDLEQILLVRCMVRRMVKLSFQILCWIRVVSENSWKYFSTNITCICSFTIYLYYIYTTFYSIFIYITCTCVFNNLY